MLLQENVDKQCDHSNDDDDDDLEDGNNDGIASTLRRLRSAHASVSPAFDCCRGVLSVRDYDADPPDFEVLIHWFPPLNAVVTRFGNKVRIDWTDAAAVSALSSALLYYDFALRVSQPPQYLIPAIPQRLAYVCWIHRILTATANASTAASSAPFHIIDIGTGAAAVYALIGHRTFAWTFDCTDRDERAIESARVNVRRNCLQNVIAVHAYDETQHRTLFAPAVVSGQYADATMCNPPFYRTDVSGRNKMPPANRKRARTGTDEQLSTRGGEHAFVCQLIQDSKQHSTQVGLFTTQIGMENTNNKILKRISEYTPTPIVQTQQIRIGRQTRFFLAWKWPPHTTVT